MIVPYCYPHIKSSPDLDTVFHYVNIYTEYYDSNLVDYKYQVTVGDKDTKLIFKLLIDIEDDFD